MLTVEPAGRKFHVEAVTAVAMTSLVILMQSLVVCERASGCLVARRVVVVASAFALIACIAYLAGCHYNRSWWIIFFFAFWSPATGVFTFYLPFFGPLPPKIEAFLSGYLPVHLIKRWALWICAVGVLYAACLPFRTWVAHVLRGNTLTKTLYVLEFASAVVVASTAGECNNNDMCNAYKAWALAAGVVSLVGSLAFIHMPVRSMRAHTATALFLAAMWLLGVVVIDWRQFVHVDRFDIDVTDLTRRQPGISPSSPPLSSPVIAQGHIAGWVALMASLDWVYTSYSGFVYTALGSTNNSEMASSHDAELHSAHMLIWRSGRAKITGQQQSIGYV